MKKHEKNFTIGHLEGFFSARLIKKPFITIFVIIFILLLVPLCVRLLLCWLEVVVKNSGIEWLSLSGSLGNWFAFFGSYCGVIATVVLGVLAVRLTIKQDQSKDYTDISALNLKNFYMYDLWRYYQPSCYGEDIGQRFILAFEIEGLKTYYRIKNMDALWRKSDEEYRRLNNLAIKQERTDCAKIKFCFNDFENCDIKDSFNYFFRLGCYGHKMMSANDKQRWLKLLFEIHYADGSSVRFVECECCLEYTGVEKGYTILTPVDHIIGIKSRRPREWKQT